MILESVLRIILWIHCVCVYAYIDTTCVVLLQFRSISAARFTNSIIIPRNFVVVAGFVVVLFINWNSVCFPPLCFI